jgi:hypothetical protein
MKVRSVGVRRVWDCMLCACVSEEGEDGEGAGSTAARRRWKYSKLFIMNRESEN